MCRNIRPLNNFEPAATGAEVHDAALQYVRKIAGVSKPSKANEAVFNRAVEEKGWNPAGVFLEATSLDAAHMQAIATEVGDSETAFLVARDTRPNVYDV